MATIKIDKQNDGRYTVRVWAKRDAFGKRKTKQIHNISGITTAKKMAKELSYELDDGKNVQTELTFNQIDDLYFAERKSKLSPTTLNTCFKYERNFARNYFGDVKIKNINTRMLQNFIDETQGSQKISEKTMKNRVSYVKAVLNWAVNQDYLEYYKIKKLEYKEDEKEFEPTTLTIDQAAEILQTMKKDFYNLYIPTLISVLTSARRSEALGLTWSDIDFTNNIISFKKSLVSVAGQPVLKHTLKTKKSKRQVPMADFLHEELLYHKEHFCLPGDDSQVCSNVFIGEISPDYVTHSLHDMILNTFNIDMREHDLRHTFSQILHDNEEFLLDRSKMMGHSNTSTTKNIYTRNTISDRFKSIVNALGDELKEKMCAKMCATQ